MIANEKNEEVEYRKKRVKRLKKIIVIVLLVMIILPLVGCVILFSKVNRLEKELKDVKLMKEEKERTDRNPLGASVAQAAEVDDSKKEGEDSTDIPKETTEETTEETEANPNADSQKEASFDENQKKVYLTFDDGPSLLTPKVLDILKKYDVKATFFVVGKENETAYALYRRIVDEGHTLGMHSYTHQYEYIYGSLANYKKDLNRLSDLIYNITGMRSTFYRFPGGSANSIHDISIQRCIKYLQKKGIQYYDWNVTNGDALSTPISDKKMIASVIDNIDRFNTVTVLMHDAIDKESTVRILPRLIKELRKKNCVLLPLDKEAIPIQQIEAES